MALRAGETLEKFITLWLKFVLRFAYAFITAFLLITVSLVFFIKANLGINTDTADMLSASLDWRQNYIAYQEAFPQFSDNLVIVIDAETPDQVNDASLDLLEKLESRPNQFSHPYQIENSDFFRQNSFLFLDTNELESLTNQLATVQPFLARLQADLNLRGLFSVLTDALEHDDADVNLDRIFTRMTATIDAQTTDQRSPLSWHALMSQRDVSPDDLRAVITLQPKLDYSLLLPGETAILNLRHLIDEENYAEKYNVNIRLTGSVALAYEELGSVTRGAEMGGLIALITVALILIVGLRSLSLVLATLAALICGLIWTAAFATFAIGELNMISVAFMVLYIGLGVDFAIHYCLGFRERLASTEKKSALLESGRQVGASLVLCALTTAIGFFAFLPTAYAGVAELGLISGTGMFISLIISLSLLPALIYVLPLRKPTIAKQKNQTPLWQKWPITHTRSILRITGLFALLSLITLPFIRFDHNPVHLMDPSTESVQTFQDLLSQSSRSPLSIAVLTDNPETLSAKLSALPSVDDVINLMQFIPNDQDEKLGLIENLSFIMALSDQTHSTPLAATEQRAALTTFIETLERAIQTGQTDQATQDLFNSLQRWQTTKNGTNDLTSLEHDLLTSLPGRLARLNESLNADAISLDDLPTELADRWRAVEADKPLYRLQVFPVADVDDNQALEAFVAEVRTIAPNATDTPIINVEASRAVIEAFQLAFALALIVIGLLLYFLLDKKTDVLIALLPLLLAGLFTTATTVIFDFPFNFANIIALPLLLGIGVDSAVHMIHRHRSALPDDTFLLGTSTARAVLISSLTTMCSFGNLAISPHQGTASMGVLLTIGLSLSLLTTLFVLPSLLTHFDEKGKTS